ncbi:hypothetical protein BDL97_02G025700 [Sphagnum fallax]|nr:hypothetical protein BDL97_02G025700 [Sphagnum fallax]
MPPELRPRKETPTPSKPAPARRSRKTPLKLANYFTAPPPSTGVENNDSKTVEKKRGRSRAKKETDEIRHDDDSIQLDSAETPNISLELTGCHAKDKEDRTEPIIQTPSKIRVDKNLGEEDCGVEEDKGEVVASAQKDNNNSCAPMSRQQRRRELDLNKSLGSWPQQLEQRESRSQTLSKKKQVVENEVEVICLDDDDDDGNCDSVEKLHGKTRVQQQLCSNKPDEAPKPSLGFVLENADEGLDAAAVGMAVEKVVEQPKETDVEMAVVEHSNVGQEEAVVVVEMAVRRQHSNASLEEASVERSMDMEKVSMGHTSSVEVVEMPEGHASAGGKIPGEKQSERGTGHALLPGDGEDSETEVLVAQKQTEEGVVQESEMIEEEKLEVEDLQSNRPENAHMRVKELRSSEREHGNEEVNDRNSGAASEQMATCSDDVEQAQEDSTPGNENQGDYQAMVDGTGGDHLKENAVKQSESAMVQDVQVGRHMVVGDRKHPLEENVKECPIDLVDSEGHNHLEENPKEDSPMLEDPQAHEVLSSIVSEEHDTVHLHASLVTERINNLQGEEIYEKRPPSEGPHTGNLHDYPLSELTPEVQERKVLEGGTLTENDAGDSHDSSSAESEPEDEDVQVLNGIGCEDEAKDGEDKVASFENRKASEIEDDTDSNDEDSEEEEDDSELIKLVAKSLNTHLKQENARVGSKDRVDPSNSTSRTDGIDEVMYIDDSRDRDAAEAAAEAMHIRWAPKTGLPMIDSKGVADSSGQRTSKGVSEKSLDRSVWRGEKDLEDGLLVPSLDPRKLRKLAKKAAKDTAGSKWFDMPAPTVTPEIKKELQLLQLRGVMDPKRHYKASDMKGIPKYFQIGTVVEGGADFYSGRLTKKERKGTFADELLADTSLKAYRKRKYKEIQEEKQAGGKKFWKQKKNRQKPSWAKT